MRVYSCHCLSYPIRVNGVKIPFQLFLGNPVFFLKFVGKIIRFGAATWPRSQARRLLTGLKLPSFFSFFRHFFWQYPKYPGRHLGLAKIWCLYFYKFNIKYLIFVILSLNLKKKSATNLSSFIKIIKIVQNFLFFKIFFVKIDRI